MKVADANTVRGIDEKALKQYGISSIQLMENAGRGVAGIVKAELALCCCKGPVAAIFAGKGNNGGDGYVAARHLVNSGIETVVYSLAKTGELKGDAGANAASWIKMGGEVRDILSIEDLESCENSIKRSSVIVDAIFGTGLSSKVEGIHAWVIEFINSLNKRVVSIDIPSGIDASKGLVLGHAVKASVTATMAMPKLGLVLFPGSTYSGAVEIVDIGVPRALLEEGLIKWNLLTEGDVRRVLKPRKIGSHKSAHGHLLVLAGSPGLTGAAYMAGVAAMRSGTGLATLGVPESLNAIMEVKTTEVMSIGLPETKDRTLGECSFKRIKELSKGKTALVIGPGVGSSEEIMRLIELIVNEIDMPLLIDADGLNSIAPRLSVLKAAKAGVVLTPHPGEMARLLKVTAAQIQNDRIGSAQRLTEKTGATVVLKGALTIISSPDGQIYINPTGNPGLATAGTGDVLAGMLGGLLAQGYGPVEAAYVAAYVHGMAGDELRDLNGEAGMMATDLLPVIPRLINSFISSEL